jgi:hypothetical protein
VLTVTERSEAGAGEATFQTVAWLAFCGLTQHS